MSTAAVVNAIAQPGPVTRRVRAYFAPVNRVTETPTLFDPSQAAGFTAGAPVSPWVDLGWVSGFTRRSDAKVAPVTTGAPAMARYQVRQASGGTVAFAFEQWTKLTLALAAGSEHLNVLPPAAGAALNGSGGASGMAQAVVFGGATATSATVIALNAADAALYSAGMVVAVDVDYTGQTGFVGSGVSAAYVKSAASVNNDPDYVRRVTFNVARVQQVTMTAAGGALVLSEPLPAGVPVTGMKVQPVLGFVDREGGSFSQEWSALFVMNGEQGDAVFYHYPRLQTMAGAGELTQTLVKPLDRVLLTAAFRALPVTDAVDGQSVFCFRTYVPAGNSVV